MSNAIEEKTSAESAPTKEMGSEQGDDVLVSADLMASPSNDVDETATRCRVVLVHQSRQNLLSALSSSPMDRLRSAVGHDAARLGDPALGGYCHLVWEQEDESNPPQPAGTVSPQTNRSRIYLGSYEAAKRDNYETLRQAGVVAIVNATKVIPCHFRSIEQSDIKYCHVAINDVVNADLLTYLPGATAFIDACLVDGGSVLVHCMAGVSRSSSIVLAYLVEYQHMSLDQAFALVKSRRQCIRPNDGFWAQLLTYEKQCRLKETLQKTESTVVVTERTVVIDKEWAKRSAALYAACRDIALPGNSFVEGCFGQLSATLEALPDKSEEVHRILNMALDYIWGRGVLPVEADWLADLCAFLDVGISPAADSAVDQVERILTNPESDFCAAWTGEIYPHQLGRVLEVVQQQQRTPLEAATTK